MKAQPGHPDRAAVAVIARVIYVLQIDSGENSAPQVGVIVAFHDVLAAVIQSAIAKQEATSAQCQVFLVIRRNTIGSEDQAYLIETSFPSLTCHIGADFDRLIYFGVGEGFMLTLVPSPACKASHFVGDLLLEVGFETVFHRRAKRVCC